ncbi:acetyltransferase, GNAT family protein [Trichomonas vaginalis G3]|uniref:N-alpha-acetyltransferase 60 n=1 Tax=Trichomonas vaginalis (strain ATCC PRA-98 / G3) TaxID=412133 RepID=A2G4Z7_TRIV3|nr:peptide alpha-N-acetyltransferase protein [Trichomonas vaginalis G3]EAX87769.1 acetyltransferase, GNAT family protein [Trichomonas vaginalis G3]KAI5506128.1 peptide alpha-N-acetyltransferase protein [Trichomonas vaginalis G3]|eukprot:XP_001300699.1 acetyltransferase, GNAT family protein [Trichomonas vaginalis G3]
MQSKFLIRRMTKDDIPGVRELQTKLFPLTYSDATYEKYISNKYLSIVLEKITGDLTEIVGVSTSLRIWVSKWSNKTEAYISTFGIDDRFRRMGLGTELMRVTARINIDHFQAGHVLLHIMKDNVSGFEFYKNRGFIAQKLIPNYYKIAEKNYDSIFMALHEFKEPENPPTVTVEVSDELKQEMKTVDVVPCFLPYFYASP